MVTAEELVVSITSDGVSETQEDLEGVENTMEDTADSAGDAAEDLEGFSQRFAGAMAAAVAGLTLGIGALASGVPVVGELFAGLGAVLEALLMQVDRLAREMGAGGLSGELFDLAAFIWDLEGAAADLVATLTVIGTLALTAAAGVAAWAVKTMGAVGAAKKLGGALLAAGKIIAGIIAGITALAAIKFVLIAAIAAFAIAYLTNWRGVRDSTNSIVGDIIDFVVGGFLSMVSQTLDAINDIGARMRGALREAASTAAEWAGNLASDAYDWGTNLIERFLDGIRSAIGRLRDLLGDLQDVGAAVGVNVPDIGGIGVGGGGSGGGASGRPRFGASGGASTGGQQIDGRQISESTGRYRSDPGRRRGI